MAEIRVGVLRPGRPGAEGAGRQYGAWVVGLQSPPDYPGVAARARMAYKEGMLPREQNLTLIGMPGVGKSTVGVLLAKASQRGFLDTDLLIQGRTGRTLQALIDAEGLEGFLRIEEACVIAIEARGTVIATGGSVVYSEAAMRHLRSQGPVVYLDLPIERIERRVANLDVRGVVMPRDGSLRALERERTPLYRAWADITIDTTDRTQDQVAADILRRLAESGTGLPGQR